MKVHRFWNEWYDHCWPMILLVSVCSMLMQKQQCTWAAAVDSEILEGMRSNAAYSIDRHAWPPMKSHDIWSGVFDENLNNQELTAAEEAIENTGQDEFEFVANSFDYGVNEERSVGHFENESVLNNTNNSLDEEDKTKRKSKVLHIFPIPVDGECLSDDGRRTGTCFNVYECRQKGGVSKGKCAMGFGVCCIFIVNCNATISNNITYIVSPQFPSFMPNNLTSCLIKVKLMSEDISQLRIDFNHFSLGQPNRRTGVCDGDIFNISGGPGGTFSLCGQNSGQHLYYDVGGRSLPRQTLYGSLRPPTLAQIYPNLNTTGAATQLIEISMNFSQRFLPIRLWEIRIAQIPFSQRAPAGCLQYHFGTEGIIQTFNFAENGRHLANQHYRICMRQETEMCSIMYEPCDEQSFRIGPSMPFRGIMQQNVNSGSGGGGGSVPAIATGTMPTNINTASAPTTTGTTPGIVASDDAVATLGSSMAPSMDPTTSVAMSSTSSGSTMETTATTSTSTPTQTPVTSTSASTSTTTSTAMSTTSTTVATTKRAETTSTTTARTTTTTVATSPLSDDVEGSGGDELPVTPSTSNVSRRPRPIGGGFDLLGFLRSAFDLGLGRRRSTRNMQQPATETLTQRQPRQIFSTCSDRITLPCIIEDFIGTGLGPLPSCEPVHCGTQFCSSGVWPCRIESTVTPFFINIHFGDGVDKGSAEDNIGACLRYAQVQCV